MSDKKEFPHCFFCDDELVKYFIDGARGTQTIFICSCCIEHFPWGEEGLIRILERMGLELGEYDGNDR